MFTVFGETDKAKMQRRYCLYFSSKFTASMTDEKNKTQMFIVLWKSLNFTVKEKRKHELHS